jgi:hypothetical protein
MSSGEGGCRMQVGWDWASETHDITVMDSAGQVIDRWSLTHDEAGLDRAHQPVGPPRPPP